MINLKDFIDIDVPCFESAISVGDLASKRQSFSRIFFCFIPWFSVVWAGNHVVPFETHGPSDVIVIPFEPLAIYLFVLFSIVRSTRESVVYFSVFWTFFDGLWANRLLDCSSGWSSGLFRRELLAMIQMMPITRRNGICLKRDQRIHETRRGETRRRIPWPQRDEMHIIPRDFRLCIGKLIKNAILLYLTVSLHVFICNFDSSAQHWNS